MTISKPTAHQSLKKKGFLFLNRDLGTMEILSRNWTSEKPGEVEGVPVHGMGLELDGL